MTLRITVVPASTQAGQYTVRALLNDKRQPIVNGIYRNPSKAPEEFVKNPQFQATQGDITATGALDFVNADAVFYVPPPTWDGPPTEEFATEAAENVKLALQKSPSVKRLVLLSAMGAQHDDIGSLVINHVSDKILGDAAPEVIIARPAFFQENWVSAFETLQNDRPFFDSFVTPLDYNKIVMISLRDIGRIVAGQLLEAGTPQPIKPQVVKMHGPREYSALDVRTALELVTGKKIHVVGIQRHQLADYYSKSVPAAYVQEVVQFIKQCLPGGVCAAEMEKTDGIVRGEVELVDVLNSLASGSASKEKSGPF